MTKLEYEKCEKLTEEVIYKAKQANVFIKYWRYIMKQLYVLCTRDYGANRLVYYTGKEPLYSSLYYGRDVLEAKRFENLQEVAETIAKYSNEFYLGINIIGIADVIFEKLEESKRTNRVLYNKFHNPNYAIR